jgi:hypothetical protein
MSETEADVKEPKAAPQRKRKATAKADSQTAAGEENSSETRTEIVSDTSAREKDNANFRKIGGWHLAAVLAALTLWGAADAWAVQSGLVLAYIVSVGNALIAGFVIASIVHEWGHFSGARLAGSISPVLPNPVRFFFMFNFDMQTNSNRQFLTMSIGGPAANWLLVVLLLILLPVDTASQALLIATVTGIAVNVSLFEIPVIVRTWTSEQPQKELSDQLAGAGLKTLPGVVVGGLVWLVLAGVAT